MNEIATRRETVPDTSEAGALARRLAAAFRSELEYHKKECRRSSPEALARAEELFPPDWRERALSGPCEEVTWDNLWRLAEENPELMACRWEELKREALDELRSGHRAAGAIEGYHATPWRRAQFLAVWEE